jgi:ribosomal protein S18 acetylase RimI-like enzyme
MSSRNLPRNLTRRARGTSHRDVESAVRLVGADDWEEWRVLRLAALGDAPYAFEATLAQWQGDGDREERWRQRLGDVAVNFVADLDGKPAGMVSGAVHGEVVDLISMWVAPSARGAGVGDALVTAVLDWMDGMQLGTARLRVMVGNTHAIALYERHGFVDAGPRALADDTDGPSERWMVRR